MKGKPYDLRPIGRFTQHYERWKGYSHIIIPRLLTVRNDWSRK